MGAGTSKSTPSSRESLQDTTSGTETEEINVPITEEGYPEPFPPSVRKAEVFGEEDCREIDENAKKAPPSAVKDYKTLTDHVTEGAKNDVQKVRGIFAWMSAQRIYELDYSGAKDRNTPEGYMKTIKQGNGTYPGFFALLCRAAKLKCAIVHGITKTPGQEAEQEDVWNAVHVDGQWRIVHPNLAFTERNAKQRNGKEDNCAEDWFLTDPDKFIYTCRPNQEAWQLLEKPWKPEEFSAGLKLVTDSSDIPCEKVCKVVFDHSGTTHVILKYSLTFDEDKSEDVLPDDLKLERYVIQLVQKHYVGLQVRFPACGEYKLEISRGKGGLIGTFNLHDSAVVCNLQPYPINPKIGFGYGKKAEEAGLSEPSVIEGIIVVKQGQRITFHFRCTQKLEIQSQLVHTDMETTQLANNVIQRRSDDDVTIIVDVPKYVKNPEYALQVNVRPRGSTMKHENVVNYLLTDGRDKSSDLRSQMVSAAEDRDMDRLEKVIPQFERSRRPDFGDLTDAKDTLKELHEEALKTATTKQNLQKLEAAIKNAKNSCVFRVHLLRNVIFKDALTMREGLKLLQEHLRDVEDLTPRSLHSHRHVHTHLHSH